MNNEQFYVLIACERCGATVEVEVNEHYLTQEKMFYGQCTNCNKDVSVK